MTAKKAAPVLNLDAMAESVAAQEAGREIDIVNLETGNPLGLRVTVAGVDSERYRMAWRAEVTAMVEGGALDTLTPERDTASKRRIAAACVIAWTPNIELGGQTYAATKENAELVFRAVPMIFDQVYGGIFNRAGFTKR